MHAEDPSAHQDTHLVYHVSQEGSREGAATYTQGTPCSWLVPTWCYMYTLHMCYIHSSTSSARRRRMV